MNSTLEKAFWGHSWPFELSFGVYKQAVTRWSCSDQRPLKRHYKQKQKALFPQKFRTLYDKKFGTTLAIAFLFPGFLWASSLWEVPLIHIFFFFLLFSLKKWFSDNLNRFISFLHSPSILNGKSCLKGNPCIFFSTNIWLVSKSTSLSEEDIL